MNKKLVIGNWKMNPLTLTEAEQMTKIILKDMPKLKNVAVVICPPFLFLDKVRGIMSARSKIVPGAQDAFYAETGAFTGEISSYMLYELGARYVILGHSERRALGETNEEINKKLKASLSAGLSPIICVGERERDEAHEYFEVVRIQVEECVKGLQKKGLSKVIIAYEPVWAISSTPGRKNALPEDSEEMAIFIRKTLVDKFGKEGGEVKIIYGGSVSEKDAANFLKSGGVDGVLVGRASLDPKKFLGIIKSCEVFDK